MAKQAAVWRRQGRRIALVPTMGALHEGHAALIRGASNLGDVVVVSIYVNPAQFGPGEDFSRYPRALAADAAMCRRLRVDAVFAPGRMYDRDHSTWVEEASMSKGRCGRSRPGHFRGVTTVVAKLFHIVQPDVAVFGQKDAQQCDVIQRMARDLDMPVRVVVAPTVREADGLALSSRNRYLTAAERKRAPRFAAVLKAAAKTGPDGAPALAANGLRREGFRVDYVEAVDGRLCAAVFLGKTRLIDNVPCR